jgi:hypothetical protein
MAKRVIKLCGWLVWALQALCTNASWAEQSLASPPHAVHSLDYGVALYDSFQDQPVAALTQLMAADQRGRLSHQDVFAQLQLGNLSLELGLTQQAEQVFSRLNQQKSMDQVVNFYLGKFYYYQHQPLIAQKWLSGITQLNHSQEQERLYYLSAIAIKNKKLDQAQQYFDQLAKDSIWQAYVSHNLALAYAKQQQFSQAQQLWTRLYAKKSASTELTLLQQRARLAQGFIYLQQNQPDAAQKTLQALPHDTPWLPSAILALAAATVNEKNHSEKNAEKKIAKAEQQHNWLQSLPGYEYEKSQGLQLAAQWVESRDPSLAWQRYQQSLTAYQQQQTQLTQWLTPVFEDLYQQWLNQKTPNALTSLLETDPQLIQARQTQQQFMFLQQSLEKNAKRLPELHWMLAARQQAHQQRINQANLQSLQARQKHLRVDFERLEQLTDNVHQQPWLLASPQVLAQQQKWQRSWLIWQNQQKQLPNAAQLKMRLIRVQGALAWHRQESSHLQRLLIKNHRRDLHRLLENNQRQLEKVQKNLAKIPDYALLSTKVINYQQKMDRTKQQLEQLQHHAHQQNRQRLRQLLQQHGQVLQTHVAVVRYQLARLSEAL